MPPKDGEQQGQEGQGSQADALMNMIVSIDKGLAQVAQVLGKVDPKIAEALEQVGEQFRSIVQAVLGGEGGGQQRPEQGPPVQEQQQMVGANRNSRQVM